MKASPCSAEGWLLPWQQRDGDKWGQVPPLLLHSCSPAPNIPCQAAPPAASLLFSTSETCPCLPSPLFLPGVSQCLPGKALQQLELKFTGNWAWQGDLVPRECHPPLGGNERPNPSPFPVWKSAREPTQSPEPPAPGSGSHSKQGKLLKMAFPALHRYCWTWQRWGNVWSH